jgi:hypothetical protein
MEPTNQLHDERSRKLALLLVLIFGLFMGVQTFHAHPLGHEDDAHCALCMVVHASVMVVALPALPVVITSVAAAPPVEAQLPCLIHLAPVSIRPPPVSI